MRVYVPSMSRADDLLSGPLGDMPPWLREMYDLTYVVPPDEAEAYETALEGQQASVLPCEARGIAATRLWIGEHARSRQQEKFFMLDDDIGFLIRRARDTWQLRGTHPIELLALFREVERRLDEYDHVGVSAREGNNRVGEGSVGLRNDNTRTLRALAYRTESFLAVEHGRVAVMEDFDVNLQILRRGGKNTCLHYWAQGQKMTNAPGGCSVYRTHEVHERSAMRLSELHPGLVKLRTKQNKTDADGFGTRTEVTIKWKRAYEEGQRL